MELVSRMMDGSISYDPKARLEPVSSGAPVKQGDKVAFVQEGDTITVWPATSVTERTAGALRQYRQTPAPTPEEERDAFAQAVADEVGESLGG